MKLRILSDLHCEINYGWQYHNVGEDIVLFAGDFGDGHTDQAFEFFVASVAPTPLFFVLGNHDYYHTYANTRPNYYRALERRFPHFHFLHNSYYDLPGFRLCGTPLWTDFKLPSPLTPKQVRDLAQAKISDFTYIRYPQKKPAKDVDIFQFLAANTLPATQMVKWHKEARLFLKQQLRESPLPLIVMTHWVPSGQLIDAKYAKHALNPYFACSMDDLFCPRIPLWVHGHTHTCIDTVINSTRHVRNPKGRDSEAVPWNPELLINL